MQHIIKYRGHFLIEGQLSTENTSIEKTFQYFLQVYNQTFSDQIDETMGNAVLETTEIGTIFTEKISRTKKAEAVLKLFSQEKSNGLFMQFLKMIVGNQGKFEKVFELSKQMDLQFSDQEYDEKLEDLLGLIGDAYGDVFLAAKNVYEAVTLDGILSTKDTSTKAKLSASMTERYTEHKEDLKLLKTFVQQQIPELYFEMFKDQKANGYAGYMGHRKLKQDDFYGYLKKHLEQREGAEYFMNKIHQKKFLLKQRTFENGVIPHQIHLEELKAILHQQEKYYPFLAENKEKIEALVTFRIPYYVGPLAKKKGKFAWLTRKSEEEIRPWTIDKTVDFTQSAADFIERMTNHDLYLPEEKVLPKHSLLYEQYAVYNELTKVTYRNERGEEQNFCREEKEKIVEELFKKQRKVSRKLLEKFLENEYLIDDPAIKGIEKDFNAGYGTYHDFIKLGVYPEFLDAPENEAMLEEIVKILTIFKDRPMIREQLAAFKDRLDQETLKKMERRHYTGWGRLSAKLLNQIRDPYSQKTILDYLKDDDDVHKNRNRNFMQLIHDDQLGFKAIIEKAQVMKNTEDVEEVVKNLAGSPAIKKGILQSLKIVDELVEIMGYEPKTIVVEMARENQTTARGKSQSKPRLKALEEAMKALGSNLLKEYPTKNESLQKDRLYLYYLQNGKDLYTGEELNISNLSHYDIDHITPQSFTTDNSLDNRVLVSSLENRGIKSDDVPSLAVVKKMKNYWIRLHQAKLISDRKLKWLTKAEHGGLTEADKAGFLQRQLVETRQITKNVASILDQRYNTEKDGAGKPLRKVQIVTLKSVLTSQFRKNFQLYKIREINDYHHGQDAYLNGVVANILLKVYPQLAPEFVYGEYRKYNSFQANKATAKKQFYTNIMHFFAEKSEIVDQNGQSVWNEKAIATGKKVMGYRQMNIVKKTEVQKGQFSNETILPKSDSPKRIPRKKNWDPKRYGGQDSPIVAYSVVISYEKVQERKPAKKLVSITVMERVAFEKDPVAFLQGKGYVNPQLQVKLPKYALYELEKGRRRLLSGAREAQKGNQLVLPYRLVTLLYHAMHCDELDGKSLNYLLNHRKDFSKLFDCVMKFAETYTLSEKKLAILCTLWEENKQAKIQKVAESFVNLMKLNSMGAPASFTFFDQLIERERYHKVSEVLDAVLIDQSITGLYETRRKLGN